VDGIAECAPNSSVYHCSSNYDSSRDLYEPRYFYHYRGALAATSSSLNSPLPDQVRALLNFVDSTHGAIHSEVDRHLSQGRVHRDQLELLFCPNHIVVSKKSGSISAFALRSWPSGRSVLELDCWAWSFDGQWLHRKAVTKSIDRPLKNIVSIRDPEVFPLQYATEEEKKELYTREQKFWDLRYKNLASYEGWDFTADQQYVSNSLRSLGKFC
jgi:hypothetical protein